MADLTTTYLGFPLRSPLVASASPLTGDVDTLLALEAAGAAAVVLPSLFEEQLTHEAVEVHGMLEMGAWSHPEATTYFPELEDYNTGPSRYLRLIENAKAKLEIPVIASLNGTTPGGWTYYARLLEDAGADALELNFYRIGADVDVSPRRVEEEYTDLVASVRDAIDVPLAVKVGPFFTAFAHFAHRLAAAGADALVLFNRFYQPDLDPETREVEPRLVLSTSEELRLVLRWLALVEGRVDADLAATTGIHTVEDVVKALLVGANVTMLASALLKEGPRHLSLLEQGVRDWLDEHDYDSVAQLRGSASQRFVGDPSGFERANYMRTLTTYSSPHLI
jgi:dihydroorotate dehydrogenase (fumarate)